MQKYFNCKDLQFNVWWEWLNTKTKHWQIRRCGAFWCALCRKLEGNTKLSKLFLLLPANSSPKRHEMYSLGVGEIVHSFFVHIYWEESEIKNTLLVKKCWTFPSKFVDHVRFIFIILSWQKASFLGCQIDRCSAFMSAWFSASFSFIDLQ